MNKKRIDYASLSCGIIGVIIEIFFMFSKIMPFLINHVSFYGKHIFIMFLGLIVLIIGEVVSAVKAKTNNTIIGIILNSVGLIISIFNAIIIVTILLH